MAITALKNGRVAVSVPALDRVKLTATPETCASGIAAHVQRGNVVSLKQ